MQNDPCWKFSKIIHYPPVRTQKAGVKITSWIIFLNNQPLYKWPTGAQPSKLTLPPGSLTFSPLKNGGWNTTFLLGFRSFSGENSLLNFGRVSFLLKKQQRSQVQTPKIMEFWLSMSFFEHVFWQHKCSGERVLPLYFFLKQSWSTHPTMEQNPSTNYKWIMNKYT